MRPCEARLGRRKSATRRASVSSKALGNPGLSIVTLLERDAIGERVHHRRMDVASAAHRTRVTQRFGHLIDGLHDRALGRGLR